MRFIISRLLVSTAFLFLVTSAGNAADRLAVFVSITPQKYFVQQIGKDLVDVQAMVQPGASPATYEPRPRQMAALSGARIYFAIGVPFEQFWLDNIAAANTRMKVIHTEEGIEKLPMAAHHRHGQDGDDHDHSGHHDEGQLGLDPHIWLSPPLVALQARRMLIALQAADPDHRGVYLENYDQFISKLGKLDARLKKMFAKRQGHRFMVFHPSWGYFANTYNIEQVAVELEGKAPKPGQLKGLIEDARKAGIKAVFVQPQFSTKSAKLIASAIGGQLVIADPLAEDWMANLLKVAEKFEAALK